MIPRDRVLDKLDSLLRSNDYAGGKRLLQYWLSEAEYTRDDHGVLLMENELMGLCRKLGEKEQALRYARDALNHVQKMGIEDNVGAATTYLNSATVCKAFGLPEDALQLFQKAQTIYERDLSPTDDRLGGLYNNMGLALVDLKQFRQAEALYQKAITVMQAVPEKEPEQAITYLNLATAAEMEHGLSQAQPMIADYAQKAMVCMEIGKDRTDGNYAFVCEKCATVFGYYGYEDYALQLKERCRRIYEGA